MFELIDERAHNGKTAHQPSVGFTGEIAQTIENGLRDPESRSYIVGPTTTGARTTHLSLTIDLQIAADGLCSVTYRCHSLNLTDRPVSRAPRDLWSRHSCGKLELTALRDGTTKSALQRLHTADNVAKFACQLSPPIQPGESATFGYTCRQHDVPWVRMTSVNAQQQVLLEGLAQALPLFARPTDQPLVARVSLAHYVELVRARLHVAVNSGASVQGCVEIAQAQVPFWSARVISDTLSDRSNDPLLRSYLWVIPGRDRLVRTTR